ncbi:hypothetical protein TruAng_009821 [Truncatella angustata]|nr:hypothetical protein TruAng_009821 [Truncatella angustata]
MMNSTEEILLKLAMAIAKEHDLSVESLLNLAETLEALHLDATVPYITFPNLVLLLSNTSYEVPGWLAASESRLDQYTAKQFNAIVKLVEARYWLGDAENMLEQIEAWEVVFGYPRHVHRQMLSKRDAKALVDLKGPRGNFSFTIGLPEYHFEDFPDCLKALRDMYFPTGIDDAIPAFTKHYCRAKTASFKLRKCVDRLERAGVVSRTCTLYAKSQKIFNDDLVDKTMSMAQRWHAATKKQMEYYQLPGVNLGLPYGPSVFAEFDGNRAFVIHTPLDGGNQHWDSIGPLYTPIRWRPGTPWLDYFRNTRQDHPMMRHFDVEDLHKCAGLGKNIPRPYEMRIPQSIVNIWLHYARMYDSYENNYAQNDGSLAGPEKTKDELAKQAKRLSDATGEPYWHVREIGIEYGTVSMYFPHNTLLAGRPRYDALGNLRFDYMGAILKELRTGHPSRDHRTTQSMALLRADCEDDTEMGRDLEGSQ